MIGLRCKTTDEMKRVRDAAEKGVFRGLGHAAASVRKAAAASIRTGAGPSPEGSPPATRRGLLRRALRFAVDNRQKMAVIGVSADLAGDVGAAFEHEGQTVFRGQRYGPRRFMLPALEKSRARLPAAYRGTVQ